MSVSDDELSNCFDQNLIIVPYDYQNNIDYNEYKIDLHKYTDTEVDLTIKKSTSKNKYKKNLQIEIESGVSKVNNFNFGSYGSSDRPSRKSKESFYYNELKENLSPNDFEVQNIIDEENECPLDKNKNKKEIKSQTSSLINIYESLDVSNSKLNKSKSKIKSKHKKNINENVGDYSNEIKNLISQVKSNTNKPKKLITMTTPSSKNEISTQITNPTSKSKNSLNKFVLNNTDKSIKQTYQINSKFLERNQLYQHKIELKIEKLKEAESKKQEFSFSPRINKNSKVKADFFNRLDKFVNKVNEKKAQNQINLEIMNMDKDGVFIRKAKEIVIKKRVQSVDTSVNNMIQWSKNKNKQLLEKQIQKSNEILNQCSFKPTLTESTLKLTKNKPRGSYAKPLNTNSSKRDRLKTPFLTTSEEFKDDSKGLFYSGLRCYVKKETNNILKSNTKNKNNLNKKLSTSSIKTYMKTTHSINQKKKLPPKHQKQKSCGQFTLTLTSDNYLSFKESTDNNNVIKEININEISEIKTKRKRKISNDELSKAVHIRNLMNTSNNFDEQSFISRTSMKI